MVMCKTDKGTLCAWTYGNNWYSKSTDKKGLAVGLYGDVAFINVDYDSDKKKIVITLNREYMMNHDIELAN